MKMRKEIMLIIPVISILVLSIVISGCSNKLNNLKLKTPKIELSTTSFDLGDIDPDSGKIEKVFFVKNVGNAPLNIISVSTSCGCTEAEVESEAILPQEQTNLIVTYDPSVHPGLVGKIKRIVYIKSNDPFQEEVELELMGNILSSKKNNEKT